MVRRNTALSVTPAPSNPETKHLSLPQQGHPWITVDAEGRLRAESRPLPARADPVLQRPQRYGGLYYQPAVLAKGHTLSVEARPVFSSSTAP